jgi:anti-sigma regulatory factor (Ser/Thr protein kinase)
VALAAEGKPMSAGVVARSLGVSRQMAHRILSRLVDDGILVRSGAGRSVSYRDSGGLPFVRRYPRAVIAEDRVFGEVSAACRAVNTLAKPARSILQYAFTEILNNAIEHSRGREIELRIEEAPDGLAFTIADDGVGAFANLRKILHLESDMVALQELSKGKLTTLPAGHTGEGIFFTSKAVRVFEMSSCGLRWTVDNVRNDTAVGSSQVQRGTVVRVEITRKPRRTLAKLFAEYTDDFAFTKTRIVVKLFTLGTRFISRSEARRVLANLEKFRSVVLDFSGVEEIGQGFADEIFRVWKASHPAIKLEAVSMSAPVAFLVRRATGA